MTMDMNMKVEGDSAINDNGHREHIIDDDYGYHTATTTTTSITNNNNIMTSAIIDGSARSSNNTKDDTLDVDDDDVDDEDELDAFLVALEKRCRSDFASCDLSRSIQQQQQQQQPLSSSSMITTTISHSSMISSPADFMRKLRKVFPRAEKNVKLNCLIGMLGLDDDLTVSRHNHTATTTNNTTIMSSSIGSVGMHDGGNNDNDDDGRKIDTQVYHLLSNAERNDDEMWVRVIAGIVRSIMFRPPDTMENDVVIGEGDNRSVKNDDDNDDNVMKETTKMRETESKKQLNKIVTDILQSFPKSTSTAHNVNDQKSGIGSGDSSSGGVGDDGVDIDPLFVPMHYSLLSPTTLYSILPEVGCIDSSASTTSSAFVAPPSSSSSSSLSSSSASFATAHFTPNMDASILNVDALAEDCRSRDEEKMREDPRKEVVTLEKQPQQTNGFGEGGGRGGVVGDPNRSIINERALHQSSGELAGRGGRGRFANMTGRGGRGINHHGTSSSSSSLFLRPASTAVGRGGLAAAGRGRTDGRLGGRLSTAAGRSGCLSRLLGTVGGGRGRGATAAVPSTAGRGGGGGGVKMLDASDVEGLNRARAERESHHAAGLTSVEARKMERKRKLMEDAAASGLKKSR